MKSLMLSGSMGLLLLALAFIFISIMFIDRNMLAPAGGPKRGIGERLRDSLFAGLIFATVFTHAGKAIVTNRIAGSGTEPVHVGMGTGAGTAAVGDTTLFTEVQSRVSGTSSRVTTTQTNDTYRVVGTITADATRAVTNAGNFDASTSGNLLVKGDFTTINLSSGDSIQFTINLQFT